MFRFSLIAFSLNRFRLAFKTIEIIVENKPWKSNDIKIPQNKSMDIRIGYNEVELRSRIKSCGGKWDTSKKVWQLPYKKIKELDLLDRIVDDES